MYNDEKLWESHYEDWKQIILNIDIPTEDIADNMSRPTVSQCTKRYKVVADLINDYESSHA